MDEKERFIKAISLARKQSMESFFNFFNKNDKDIESMIVSGKEAFNKYIFSKASPYLKDKKKALEIGYGGGNLIQEASKHFDKVYGVDIHNEERTVYEMLDGENIMNVLLKKGNGTDIPFESNSVDLVYSYRVFRHLKWEKILESYLAETTRVLKKGGIAVLYFGKLFNKTTNDDGMLEGVRSLVNFSNLRVDNIYAQRICRKNGLEVIDISEPDKRNINVNVRRKQLCLLTIKV